MPTRLIAVAAILITAVSSAAFGADPKPWGLGLPTPVSGTAERIEAFHDLLLWIITAITIFVIILLGYVCVRFRESRNPTPSRTTHNTLVEVLWTVIPVLILVAIAVPSFRLMYYADRVEDADMTLKVVGHQWYWSYEYPDHGNFTFDANMVAEADLKPGQYRLMETDNRVVLPVGKKVRLLFTSTDVLHSWAISEFGVRLDAVPGRLNETWVEIDKPGVYYGFCSELCGVNHAYMPITVEAVPVEQFDAWVKDAQTRFAKVDEPSRPAGEPALRVAQTESGN
ncbi:MAG: cytochrome c oxidase subunit II [Alphaproteobacteria bacterium]